MSNLLRNSSFEKGWWRATRYWTADGGPYFTAFGNIFTPEHWVSWWQEGTKNYGSPPDQLTGRPEVNITTPIPDPVRVYSGIHAAQIFTFWRNQKCGLYQVVEGIKPGQRLRLTAFAHGWYSDCDFKPHGPPYFQDCTTRAMDSHMYLRVGISPTGMEDPLWTGDVVWSENVEIYGRYGPMLVVEAVAESDTVTAFLRSNTNFALKHCDAYWDHVSLEVVDEGEPCKGLPRMQYRRVVNVVPPSATDEQAAAVFLEGWQRGRETTSGSYDDAGVGDLDEKVANLYGIPDGQQPGYQVFYDEFYPGTAVNFLPLPDVGPLVLTYPTTYMPPVITQPFVSGVHGGIDLRSSWALWRSEILAAYDGKVVVAGGEDPIFGYQVLTRTVLPDGCVMDLRYAHMLPDLYVSVGDEVVAGQKLGKADNTGKSDGDHLHFSVYLCGEYVDPEPLIDWPEQPTPVPPLEGIPLGYHGQVWSPWMHEINASAHMRVNKGLAGMQDYDSVRRAWEKTLWVWRHFGSQHEASTAPMPAAGAAIWLAKFSDGLRNYCNELEQKFPGIETPYFYVESLNEMVATHDPKLSWFLELDRQFILQLAEVEPRVKAVVFCAAVGNPAEDEYELLVPLARTAQEYGALMGYHAYWAGDSEQSYMTREHWPYLQGRWTEMDKVLVANGIEVQWFFGECGVVGGHPLGETMSFERMEMAANWPWTENRFSRTVVDFDGIEIPMSADPWKMASSVIIQLEPHGEAPSIAALMGGGYYLNPGSGWLDPHDCYGGNWARYRADLVLFSQWVEEWNVTHKNRALGGAVFTTGANYTGWEWFQMQKDQWRSFTNT